MKSVRFYTMFYRMQLKRFLILLLALELFRFIDNDFSIEAKILAFIGCLIVSAAVWAVCEPTTKEQADMIKELE